ncbi:MAG: hypothetical protein IJ156_08055 [Bacteroidales bacterium]|nr:hypothetical protein [Bacteroidales bacterium]
MKRIIAFFLFLALSAGAFAQEFRLPQINEIAEVENEDDTVLSLFSMARDGQTVYFLNVGQLGVGDEVFQVQFDPVFQLFIPLGGTLEASLETLGQLQELLKEPDGTVREIEACFAPAMPNASRETAKVTIHKRLFGRQLEFSLEREGYIRATYVSRSDFNSLVSSAKFYRRFHPKEQ